MSAAHAVPRPDTRAAIVREASAIVEREGVTSLAFRAVAKAVGKTPMALYHYFADGPRELLAVVAELGFRQMIETLRQNRSSEPKDRVIGLALRYVRFGVERPNLYRALFHEQLADPLAFHRDWAKAGTITALTARHYEALDAVKAEAFRIIVDSLAEAQAQHGIGKGDPEEFALALAALVHGLVGEFIDEGLYRRTAGGSPWSEQRRKMARRVIELMVAGLDSKSSYAADSKRSNLLP